MMFNSLKMIVKIKIRILCFSVVFGKNFPVDYRQPQAELTIFSLKKTIAYPVAYRDNLPIQFIFPSNISIRLSLC